MVAAPPLDRISVKAAVDHYLVGVQRAVRGHSLSAATAANYERDLAEFCTLVGPATVLDDLTAEDIDDAVLAYGATPDGRFARPQRVGGQVKTRGPGAQIRFRQSVARLFTEAVLSGWVQASPMPRTKVRPKTRGMINSSRKALPQATASALVDQPVITLDDPDRRVDMRLGLRDHFLLRLLMEVGPRVSEVSQADRADLERRDDGATWLRLLGKGNKERWVPLSPPTVDAYAAYLAHERPQPRARTRRVADGLEVVDAVEDAERALLLTWRGLRMKPRDIQLMVARQCADLPADSRRAVTPHGLRHTAATLLLASGAADVTTVRDMLGHASVATTGLYLDAQNNALVAAVRDHPVTGVAGTRRPL